MEIGMIGLGQNGGQYGTATHSQWPQLCRVQQVASIGERTRQGKGDWRRLAG